MSLMFSRRRFEAKKAHEANKAKAHKENHAAAKAAAVEQKPKPAKKVSDGADKSGTK